jgi:TetR/AcrR family transcriptional repressor of nem operon
MRKSRDETAATRERILARAAEMVRRGGIETLGVADLMQEVGLTHGGFYRHFKSKEDLVAAAVARAFAESGEGMRRRVAADPARALERIVTSYLSEAHRRDPAHGCTVAALATEAPRHGGDVGAAFARGARGLIERLVPHVHGADAAARHDEARAIAATMLGAIALARAVDDPAEARAILTAAKAKILEPYAMGAAV